MPRVPFAGGLLFVAALAGRPLSIASAQAVKPGDDFFTYANDSWLRATEIPEGRERWNARLEIGELTRQQLQSLLDAASSAPAGTVPRKVGDFRAAYLNEAAIERRGLAPVRPILDSINQVTGKPALTRLLGSSLRADVDPLNWGIYRSSSILGLSVEPGIHGEKTNIAFLLQGGLGLPDREFYVSSDAPMVQARTAYETYIGRLLALAGFDDAKQRAAGVMALETTLAQAQATQEASANDHNADSVWTRADFARRAPGMDWTAFFAAAGLGRQATFVAWQPGAITGLAALVSSQPLERWKDYLRVRALDTYADVLPSTFAAEAMTMRTAVTGRAAASRQQRASEATLMAMSDAVGMMYAERYFPAAQKARVDTIVANVIAAFRQRVEAAAWMSPATKSIALAKLQSIYFGIGYPDAWRDYSGVVVDSTDPVGNLRRVADQSYRIALAQAGQQVDVKQWWIAPQRVGAVLVFQQNAYNFPAALLQAPKYDPAASDAASYGAIGAIVGHEVSHFVDMLGAEWDDENRLRHWWTVEDSVRFQAAAAPLGKQVASYQPLPGVSINPALTQVENVADLAGLVSAFEAYRKTLGNSASDPAYVREQDREFFLGFARSWRGEMRDDALRTQLATDGHAPEKSRIATVRNLDAWYDAFDVQPGQALYLEPASRVRVW